jgi:fatty-acyl-CoA synthase
MKDCIVQAASLGASLREAAKHWPAAPAFADGSGSWSFSQMDESVDHVACGLLALGLQRGDRIGVLGPNQIGWLRLFLAAARIGVCVVALSVRYRDHELLGMLGESGARALFTVRSAEGVDFVGLVRGLRDRLDQLAHVGTFEADADGALTLAALERTPIDARRLAQATAAVGADDAAMVIFTSGTTGRPKGALLTHGSMLAAARAEAEHLRIVPGDHLKVAMPLNHVGGITCCILTMLLGGASSELVPAFKAETVLQMMAARPPTVIVGVPTMLTLLLMHREKVAVDLSRVRLVITGGSNADGELLSRLMAAMPRATVMNLYGMSESSGALVMTPWDADRGAVLSSIGRPLPGAELRVVGPSGADVPAGEVGELWFRGLGVVKGYLGREATEGSFGSDGWLRTGDMGCIEESGFIHLRGRKKDMFIQGGFNVYPAEVENFIASHPHVLMVAGIGVPDPVLGEVGRYYVVLRAGAATTAEDLRTYCAQHLADYKVPRQIVFRDQLPLTPTGKVLKAALRDTAGD